MRQHNRAVLSLLPISVVALALLGLSFALRASPVTLAQAEQSTPLPKLYVFRVSVRSSEDVTRLTAGGWDVLEARGPDYLLVLGDDGVAQALRAQGFTVSIDQRLEIDSSSKPFSYYGGYRTVAEHYQHLDAIAAAHPDLAVVVDYGDSWRKVNSRPNGHDLKAICITRLRPGDCVLDPDTDKPRFLLLAAIHARELTTAELAWRWMDYLSDNYNVDPDVTALLDYNELWIAPVANPDGRVIVESGGNAPYLQRKNANNSLGACSVPPNGSNQHGVDLNRNANFQFGSAGSTTAPCDQTYRGASAASEPEEYALEALMQNLFHDQRGPALTDAAPLTTTGVMLTLHSFSDLVLLPWGWTECFIVCSGSQRAPNDAGLRSLGFRMSYYNGYATGQGSELLYAAGGTTDDWAYGVLGIPAVTFEIGSQFGSCGGFTPPYSCQDGTFWPLNRAALVYAAKSARQPYATALGPTAWTPVLNASFTAAGVPVTLTATIRDDLYGNTGVGRPAAQAISQAEVYVDVPPWAGGTPIALNAQDGSFNSASEGVIGQLDTALSVGRHILFVRGRDAAGNWGSVTAVWLYVVPTGNEVYLSIVTR
ncbi:MAG TPA: M14 family zinc carboxypeptidase [Anaerolineae bacterium]|nr:M14 family zinc carboxypeptidase [Anaerolineae bacterium]